MNRLFSIHTAALVSAVALVAAWPLSTSGQGVESASGVGDAYESAESGGIRSNPAAALIDAALIDSVSDETPLADRAVLVPMNPAWETDLTKLLAFLSTKPEYLNSQQLRILDGGLENRTESLTEQYAAATDEARRKELEAQLSEAVEQHFAVRQAIRDREIAKLEREVARLRELLQQREDAKQQIVQGRVDQLIRSAKGLGWDGNERGPWRRMVPVPAAGPAAATEPMKR